jgi:UDP-N-acetyl-2-amino-2-deoxyglucuronate dehydrogenase
MLKLAVVGVGWAGSRHIEAVGELGRKIEVACLVDNDAEFLRQKAAQLGIATTYTDYEAVLADPKIDAVSICTPHNSHCPMAVQAAQAGKHVLVEKPMATHVEDADRMLEAAAQAGIRLYVAENAAYDPPAKFLRQVVQSGEYIGELVHASCTKGFRAPQYAYPGRRAWLAQPELGGSGTWLLHGIHSMAQLRFIFGEVSQIYLRQHKTAAFGRPGLEGTVSGTLTLQSGVQVSVVQSSETKLHADLGGYVLHGTQGSLRATDTACTYFSDTNLGDTNLGSAEEGVVLEYPAASLSGYAQEIEAFADYITSGVEGPTSGRSERCSLAIVQAGYESAATGIPVDLATRFGDPPLQVGP